MKFKVYYSKNMRDDLFRAGDKVEIPGLEPLTYDEVITGHALITELDAAWIITPVEVFFQMQGENWSPNGEARDLIEASGTHHTSMSVGDAMVDEDGIMYIVKRIGFRTVEKPVVDVTIYVDSPVATVYMVTPHSEVAKTWVDENVPLESYQWIGGAFAVEHGYIGDLVLGMQEAGLRVE